MKRFSVVLALAAICTLSAAKASAQANLALQGIGLKIGVVDPEDIDATFGLGLFMDLGTLAPHFAFESYAGYWSQTEEVTGAEVGVRDLSFGAKTKYMFESPNPTVQPYLGAGLGFHVLNAHADVDAIYFGNTLVAPASSESDTEVKLGMDLGGGVKIDRGSQFAFIGEGWYTIVSDASHLSFMVGAVYMFGR